MKIAVSIPDDVFQDAEKLARRCKTSRSALYSRALKELLARQDEDEITERMNRTLDDVGSQHADLDFVTHNAARVLKNVEW